MNHELRDKVFLEGLKIVYPQKKYLWEKCVNIRFNDFYGGVDLSIALEVMKALQKGTSFKKCKKMLDEQNLTGSLEGIVYSVIKDFSKRGTNFIRTIRPQSNKLEQELKQIENENISYENTLNDKMRYIKQLKRENPYKNKTTNLEAQIER